VVFTEEVDEEELEIGVEEIVLAVFEIDEEAEPDDEEEEEALSGFDFEVVEVDDEAAEEAEDNEEEELASGGEVSLTEKERGGVFRGAAVEDEVALDEDEILDGVVAKVDDDTAFEALATVEDLTISMEMEGFVVGRGGGYYKWVSRG
jgi:hypothetical protein